MSVVPVLVLASVLVGVEGSTMAVAEPWFVAVAQRTNRRQSKMTTAKTKKSWPTEEKHVGYVE